MSRFDYIVQIKGSGTARRWQAFALWGDLTTDGGRPVGKLTPQAFYRWFAIARPHVRMSAARVIDVRTSEVVLEAGI